MDAEFAGGSEAHFRFQGVGIHSHSYRWALMFICVCVRACVFINIYIFTELLFPTFALRLGEDWGADGGGSGGNEIMATPPFLQLNCNTLGAELAMVPVPIRLGLKPLPQPSLDEKAEAAAIFVRAATPPTSLLSSPPSKCGEDSCGVVDDIALCNIRSTVDDASAGASSGSVGACSTNSAKGVNLVQLEPSTTASTTKNKTEVGAGRLPADLVVKTNEGDELKGGDQVDADSEQEDLEDWLDSVL